LNPREKLADEVAREKEHQFRHSERSEESLFLSVKTQEGFLASLGMTVENDG
jgi:hypothetical protein